ncbi:hypothetical protein KUTeg_007437 [Tegillarca granosa]|uniref:Armadillo repeat-containing protein 2 n=1 Tax=Tegillarca granosa TaxID=220873 RepID=A0ABQ9FFL5_TEGGR|nr:hypothetical protein KUTeg_007437 [Tegillarca granosa]
MVRYNIPSLFIAKGRSFWTPKFPTEAELESGLLPPKPPSDPNKSRRKAGQTRLHHANSYDGSVEGISKSKSGSLTDVSSKTPDPNSSADTTRRIHSGPKERTHIPVEERGEGDGKEMAPRAPSSAAVRSPPRSASSRDGSESRIGSGGTKRTSSAGSTGRAGSAGKKEVEETPEEAKFYSQNIAPILETMSTHSKKLLIDTLRSTDHTTSSEALIYCTGAIKFLSGNTTIVKQLVKKDCIECLGQLLTGINRTNRDIGNANEQFGHVLVQVTAALRNLADANSSRDRLLSCQVVPSLCHVIDTYSPDQDLMLNISRIFSKITLHSDCCLAVADQPTSYKSFIHLLNKHILKSDIVVRVCFILGNITAKNEDARMRLYQEANAFQSLLSVLKIYLEMDVKSKGEKDKQDPSKESSEDGRSVNKQEDVLIKVIRVIANLAINENVGPLIASNHQCVDLLMSVLEVKELSTSEELVLNTVATINNLSYYTTKTSAITAHQIRVIESLLKLVLADNMEAMVEVFRVFGNLTRQKAVRDFLVEHKIDQMMITMLDSGNREVVYISCGVLINFMVDEEKRPILRNDNGIKKLIDVLRDFGQTDWELASLVCQILWNYSGKITSTNAWFGEQEASDLIELLVHYLDQDAALDNSLKDEADEEMKMYILDQWSEEFCPVAGNLLQRLESFQSNFEPLDNPSGS